LNLHHHSPFIQREYEFGTTIRIAGLVGSECGAGKH
jgi:hypothetical protein